MPAEGSKLERYCPHCGTVTIFNYSEHKKQYYCTVCGALLEGADNPAWTPR